MTQYPKQSKALHNIGGKSPEQGYQSGRGPVVQWLRVWPSRWLDTCARGPGGWVGDKPAMVMVCLHTYI
jgi:hypothetical protein